LGSPAEAQAFVADLTVSLDGRVLLLTPDGRLLAAGGQGSDSATQPLQPAGITTAIQGQQSVLVTYGLTEQTAEVLVPITDGTGKVVGIVGVIQTLSGLESLVNRMRMFVLATLVVELILGTVIGLLLARRLARPITVAASAVVDLSEGRAVTPMVEQGPREIRQLSTGVNILSERLRLLEETRRRSLANIVHELGRPLGAMRSAVHVLRGPVGDDPAIRDELLGGVEGQIERMQPLFDDLAQLHGQGQGVVVLDRELTRLDEWLPPILLPWRAAALEKGLAWQATIAAPLPAACSLRRGNGVHRPVAVVGGKEAVQPGCTVSARVLGHSQSLSSGRATQRSSWWARSTALMVSCTQAPSSKLPWLRSPPSRISPIKSRIRLA
jgi:signal transduction histidine kinase